MLNQQLHGAVTAVKTMQVDNSGSSPEATQAADPDQKSPLIGNGAIDFEGLVQAPNIELTVKNMDTLQQFTNKCHLDLDYIPKLQKWIDRKKYTCDEEIEEMQL